MNAEVLAVLRQRKVLISTAVALVVLLIWLVAVFAVSYTHLDVYKRQGQA